MNQAQRPARISWPFVARVLVKAAVLFAALNALFASCNPLGGLGGISLYNRVVPGRERLPYGENPSASNNLSLSNLTAMFASHEIAASDDDEYRVVVIGDSATWGWLQQPNETLAARIQAHVGPTAGNGSVRVYNLGYPGMSLLKDLVILDRALEYHPDLIVWAFTLESFPRDRQVEPSLVYENPDAARDLISRLGLQLDSADPRFAEREGLDRTIVGSRRELADLLRLQLYGVSWAATGIDIDIPEMYTPRQSDLPPDDTWRGLKPGTALDETRLAFDVLDGGVRLAGDVPVLLVNEPIYRSDGANSDIRYNSFYPHWAYDAYRDEVQRVASERGWRYVDAWDLVDAGEFTDTPVHMTPAGTDRFAAAVAAEIDRIAGATR